MQKLRRHVGRCLIAGVVALLPLVGTVLGVVYAERTIAESWLAEQPFYFPGLGLLAVAVLVYAIGLITSSLIGRWLWKRADTVLDRVPLLGGLYQTLKQILGYGGGPDALFKRVVMVPTSEGHGHEMALVTAEDSAQLTAFVPTAPNPTVGRLVQFAPSVTTPLDLPVNQALQNLVALGALPSEGEASD